MSTIGRTEAIRSAEIFFKGKICVVRGTDAGVDWHHLDENSSNWFFENIIPIEKTNNGQIEIHRRDSPRQLLPEDCEPRVLEIAGSNNYQKARFHRAYGCTRLAGFLYLNHEKDPNAALRCASLCLVSTRPVIATGGLDLAVDVLRRSVREVVADPRHLRQVDIGTKAMVIAEAGSWFIGCGDARTTQAMHQVALDLMSKQESVRALNPGELLAKARMLQHLGISAVGANPRDAAWYFQAANEIFESRNAQSPINSNMYWEAVGLLKDSKVAAAIEKIEANRNFDFVQPEAPLLTGERRKIVSYWAIGELLALRADLERARGGDWKSWARAAFDFFKKSGIVPTGVAPHSALFEWQEENIKDKQYQLPVRSPETLAVFKSEAWRAIGELLRD
jgi:hypothetical protein